MTIRSAAWLVIVLGACHPEVQVHEPASELLAITVSDTRRAPYVDSVLALRALSSTDPVRRFELSDTRRSFRVVLATDRDAALAIEREESVHLGDDTPAIQSKIMIPYKSVQIDVLLVDLGLRLPHDLEIDQLFEAFREMTLEDKEVIASEANLTLSGAPAHRFDIYRDGDRVRTWLVLVTNGAHRLLLRFAIIAETSNPEVDEVSRMFERLEIH